MASPLTRRLQGVGIAGLLAVALVLPGAAAADTTPAPTIRPAVSQGATISVAATAIVTAKLVASVETSFTCDPFDVTDWATGETSSTTEGRVEFGEAMIFQAQGRQIATGQGSVAFGGDVTCDGTTVNRRSVDVVAQNLPWRSGSAVAAASIAVSDLQLSDFHDASTGAVTVKLVRG